MALAGQSVVVEPCLAEAAKELGLRHVPLPADVAHEKATMALVLALGMLEHLADAVRPEVVADFLDAALAFETAAPWRFIDSDVPLRVEVSEDGRRRTLDGAVMGQGEQEYGVVLYPEAGSMQRLLASDHPERTSARMEVLGMSLEDEPEWAAAAIEQALGQPVVPIPMHSKRGRPRRLDARKLATLTAMLRAASELQPGSTEARGTSAEVPRVEVALLVPSEAMVPVPLPHAAKPRHDDLAPDVRLVLEIIAFADAHHRGWRDALPPPWPDVQAEAMSGQLLMPLLAHQGPLPGTRLTPALFWASRHGRLDPATAELFEAEQRARLSVWEVLEVRAEVGLVLLDLLTGEQRFVHEVSGTRGLASRHALLARVLTVRERSSFSGVHPVPLPPAEGLTVVTAIRRRLRTPTASVPAARLGEPGVVEALLEHWQAAVERLEAACQVKAKLENTDGEPFEPYEDRFAIARGTGRKQVAAAVLALPGAMLDEEDRGTTVVTLTRPGNAVHRHWPATVIGRLTITSRVLVLETNSRARNDALRSTLEAALGPRITHRKRTRSPAMQLEAPLGDELLMLDAMASPGPWRKPPELLLREHVRLVLDKPLDALGGLTPRAAVAKAASRRALHQWIKELEHADAHDVAEYLREALELSPTGELVPVDAHARRTGRGRKVSETLLDFAAPLLEDLRDPAAIRPALELAAMVWNADVLDGRERTTMSEAMKATAARTGLPEAEAWIERLRARRRCFAGDERLIEVLEVQWDDGDVYVEAAARLSPAKSSAPRRKR